MTTSTYINCLNDIENAVSNMSTDELETLATETQETLDALMNELKKRQAEKQHSEIDNLEEHLQNADISFKSLKDFIAMALKEIRR